MKLLLYCLILLLFTGLIIGMFPLLGWVNWFNILLAIFALILAQIKKSKGSTIVIIVIILVAIIRLMMGGGLI